MEEYRIKYFKFLIEIVERGCACHKLKLFWDGLEK